MNLVELKIAYHFQKNNQNFYLNFQLNLNYIQYQDFLHLIFDLLIVEMLLVSKNKKKKEFN